MAIQFPEFKRLSFDEANPWLVGAERGQKLAERYLMSPQELQQKILENKLKGQEFEWNPRLWESQIGLQGAQAGLAGTEADINRYKLNNPMYINADAYLMQLADRQRQVQEMQQKQQEMSNNAPTYQPNLASQLPGGGQTTAPQPPLNEGAFPRQQAASMPSQSHAAQQYDQEAYTYNPPNLPSPLGNPTLDNLYWKKYGMSPYQQAQLDLAQNMAQQYQTENLKRVNEANVSSSRANELGINTQNYLDALEKMHDIETGPLAGKNQYLLSQAAQKADAYSAAIVANMSQAFQPTGGHINAADIELQKMAKADRNKDKPVNFDLAQGIIAKAQRVKDMQQFYSLGAQLHLKPPILDTLWQSYETERPYFNVETKLPNTSYDGTWRDYLTPDAVNSAVRGEKYTPPNQKTLSEMNLTKKDLEDIDKWAKDNQISRKGLKKDDLYRLMRNEGITWHELKKELKGRMKQGEKK